tara:strand:+ start:447 stop:614 length:168 start_codon:yes stop_codon:yes gene_type:complete
VHFFSATEKAVFSMVHQKLLMFLGFASQLVHSNKITGFFGECRMEPSAQPVFDDK